MSESATAARILRDLEREAVLLGPFERFFDALWRNVEDTCPKFFYGADMGSPYDEGNRKLFPAVLTVCSGLKPKEDLIWDTKPSCPSPSHIRTWADFSYFLRTLMVEHGLVPRNNTHAWLQTVLLAQGLSRQLSTSRMEERAFGAGVARRFVHFLVSLADLPEEPEPEPVEPQPQPQQAEGPEEAVVEPEEAEGPEEAVVEPEEAVVEPEEAVVEPEEAVVEPEEAEGPEEEVDEDGDVVMEVVVASKRRGSKRIRRYAVEYEEEAERAKMAKEHHGLRDTAARREWMRKLKKADKAKRKVDGDAEGSSKASRKRSRK